MATQEEIDAIQREIAALESALRDLTARVAALEPDDPMRVELGLAVEDAEAELIHAYKVRATLLAHETEFAGVITRKPNAPTPLTHWAGADWTVRISKP
jgi:hypothetical protein